MDLANVQLIIASCSLWYQALITTQINICFVALSSCYSLPLISIRRFSMKMMPGKFSEKSKNSVHTYVCIAWFEFLLKIPSVSGKAFLIVRSSWSLQNCLPFTTVHHAVYVGKSSCTFIAKTIKKHLGIFHLLQMASFGRNSERVILQIKCAHSLKKANWRF